MIIECSNWAYERLEALRIQERARTVGDDLKQIFLYKTIYEAKANQILEDVRRDKPSDISQNEEQEDILSLERQLEREDFITDIEPFVIAHPLLVARIVMGHDLDNFLAYGFNTRRNLAGAVAAYCIGEKDTINQNRSTYSWRQQEYKNKVQLLNHGDMGFNQTDVSGSEESCVLVGPQESGFGLQQDWSPFLISVLKYARAIGRSNLSEIVHWQDLLNELRRSNPWGCKHSAELSDPGLGLSMQFERSLLGEDDKRLVVWINDDVLPYLNDGSLDFIRKHSKGELEIQVYRCRERFQRVAHFIPEDIPHLMRANYQLYARDLDDLAKIMYWFN